MRRWAPVLLVLLVALSLVLSPGASGGTDPLPSWRDGPTKQAILDFVTRTTTPDSPDFVATGDRIAALDNDGTLWLEKPIYVQLAYIVDVVRRRSTEDPALARREPYRALLEGDGAAVERTDRRELLQALLALEGGSTSEAFEADVTAWFERARDVRFARPYTTLVYQPMLELLAYLRAKGFTSWICTGGGGDFVRTFAADVYDVPPERVIGSELEITYEDGAQGPRLVRQQRLAVLNDKEVKPASLYRRIGRRPILAVGNSDGDLAMLRWVASGSHPGLAVLVHHDDAEREYAYTSGTEKALEAAARYGWTVARMRSDWTTVFPSAPSGSRGGGAPR